MTVCGSSSRDGGIAPVVPVSSVIVVTPESEGGINSTSAIHNKASSPSSPSHRSKLRVPLSTPPESTRHAQQQQHASNQKSPTATRRTNIQVCVRVRPLIVDNSDELASSHADHKGSAFQNIPTSGKVLCNGRDGGKHGTTSSALSVSSQNRSSSSPSQRKSGLQPPSSSAATANTSGSSSSRIRPPSALRIGRSLSSRRKLPSPTASLSASPAVSLTESSLRRLNPTYTKSDTEGGDDVASVASNRGSISLASLAAVGAPTIAAWEVSPDGTTVFQSPITNPKPTRKCTYSFDRVFGPETRTASIYDESVREVVWSAMEGYHGSVFAYGQTSSGKTYTMSGTTHEPGVVPLAVKDCFDYIRNQKNEEREYLLRVSYMEIYNEQINDLLAPPQRTGVGGGTMSASLTPSTIRIFESKHEGVIIRGLREEVVTSPEQVFALIASGEARRQTGSTNLNRSSSRSHSIFRLLIESRLRSTSSRKNRKSVGFEMDGGEGSSVESNSSSPEDNSSIATSSAAPDLTGPIRVSSLSLVDLAGSECAKATGSTGARQKEGQYINKSLMTLGHVIWKLSELSSRAEPASEGGTAPPPSSTIHIPYRDSKLTRLLQPSLSGNAQICVICTISPQVRNMDESHNTLKFATRAKRIKQSASITEVMDDKTLLQSYREEIELLKRQLKEAQEAQKLLQEQREQQNGNNNTDPAVKKQEASSSDAHATGGADTTANIRTPASGAAARSIQSISKSLLGGSDDADEDTHALVTAIENLEQLILKASSSVKKDKSRRFSKDEKNTENEETAPDDGADEGITGAEDLLWEDVDEGEGDVGGNGGVGPLSPTLSEHMTRNAGSGVCFQGTPPARNAPNDDGNETDSALVTELQRIRGLLGSLLKKKAGGEGGSGSATPSFLRVDADESNSHLSTPALPTEKNVTLSPATPTMNGNGHYYNKKNFADFQTPHRDEEVELLRAQLNAQEVATSLRKADSSFLQSQLAEKDSLLKEVVKILDAVEKRQVELEKENASMKDKLARMMAALASRDAELISLKAQLSADEDLLANLT